MVKDTGEMIARELQQWWDGMENDSDYGWEVQLKVWPFGEVRWGRKSQMKVTFQISGWDGRCCPLAIETTGWSCSLGGK